MPQQPRSYWMELVEKLNSNQNLASLVPEALESVCRYLQFECSFLYRTDHAGILHLAHHYAVDNHPGLPSPLDLDVRLHGGLMRQFVTSKSISFRRHTQKDALAEALGGIFGAQSLVLVPITTETDALMGLLGMVDRRGEARHEEENVTFIFSVLSTLATYIKMQLYRDRAETTQKSLESVMDNMGVDVYVNDFYTHEVLYANQSMAAPYGGKENLVGHKCWQALYHDKTGPCDYCPQNKLLDETGAPSKIYSWDYQRPFDGSWFRVLSGTFRWVDGRLAHVVSSIDITESKQNELIIRELAEYDHLTHLPNRFKLTSDMDARILQLEAHRTDSFLLFFDLDGFKAINDTLGHGVGDELLVQIGRMLQDNPFTRDNTYRYGGDEFVVLCDDTTGGTISQVLDVLEESFSKPWQLSAGPVECGLSIGVSHFPYDSDQSSELLRQADAAMYESKKQGKGRVFFYNRGIPTPPDRYFATYHIR